MTLVTIIDYGSGNLRSAEKAFERAAGEAGIAAEIRVTDDAAAVRAAERIVLPGVGAFADCMDGVEALPGMRDALEEAVIGAGKPFLGICVGMQLMAEEGREYGRRTGLGWIQGVVERIAPRDSALKIPHMGWNELVVRRDHPVLDGIESGAHAYFVHSFYLRASRDEDVLATVDYGGPVTAVVGRDNLVGTQFHPEKSQKTGLRLITNFLRWTP